VTNDDLDLDGDDDNDAMDVESDEDDVIVYVTPGGIHPPRPSSRFGRDETPVARRQPPPPPPSIVRKHSEGMGRG